MSDSIRVAAVSGGDETEISADELRVTLPSGLVMVMYVSDASEDGYVTLMLPVHLNADAAAFKIRPGAVNQIALSAEILP